MSKDTSIRDDLHAVKQQQIGVIKMAKAKKSKKIKKAAPVQKKNVPAIKKSDGGR